MAVNFESDKYIDGWLQFKEVKKYESFWFALRAAYENGVQIGAHLHCYNEREENLRGTIFINFNNKDTMECIKIEGKRENDFKFSVLLRTLDFTKSFNDKLEDKEFHFCAYDNITRERWLYALCDLAGNHLPPDLLPTEQNSILATRPKAKSPFSFKKHSAENDLFKDSSYKIMARRGSEFLIPSLTTTPTPTSPSGRMGRRGSDFIISYNEGLGRPVPTLPRQRPVSPGRSVSPGRPTTLGRAVSPSRIGSLPAGSTALNCNWYHGKLPRPKCEQMLRSNIPGAYMLRESSSQCNSYSCSFKNENGEILHLIITPTKEGMYKISERNSCDFHSPIEAAQFYMQKKISSNFKPFPIRKKPQSFHNERANLPAAALNQSFDQQRLTKQLYPDRRIDQRGATEKSLSRSQGEIRIEEFRRRELIARMENVKVTEEKKQEAFTSGHYIRMDDEIVLPNKQSPLPSGTKDDDDDDGYLKLTDKNIPSGRGMSSPKIEKRYENSKDLRRIATMKETMPKHQEAPGDPGMYDDHDYLKLDGESDDFGEYTTIEDALAAETVKDEKEIQYEVMDDEDLQGTVMHSPRLPQKASGIRVGETVYLNLDTTDAEPYVTMHGDNNNEDSYVTMSGQHNDEDSYVTMSGQHNDEDAADDDYVKMDRSNFKGILDEDADERYVTMR